MRRPSLTKKVVDSLVRVADIAGHYHDFEEDPDGAAEDAGIIEGYEYIRRLIDWHVGQARSRQDARIKRASKKHEDAAEASYQREQELRRKNAEENRRLGFVEYAEKLERQLEEDPATWAEYIALAKEEGK